MLLLIAVSTLCFASGSAPPPKKAVPQNECTIAIATIDVAVMPSAQLKVFSIPEMQVAVLACETPVPVPSESRIQNPRNKNFSPIKLVNENYRNLERWY